MIDIVEILKYTLPLLVVFAIAYLMIKTLIENDQQKRKFETQAQNHKIVTPIRLQAYERLILFIERISPELMIKRVIRPGMTSKHLQHQLIDNISSEYEHNLSQQIYVSIPTWDTIKSAKNNVILLINSVAGKIRPEAPAIELSKLLLEVLAKVEKSPTANATELIKKEMTQFF
jgi:hypothetical protein